MSPEDMERLFGDNRVNAIDALLDAIKKGVIYRKAYDRANIIEELGDIEFYFEGLRQGMNISRDETIQANIKKLSVRYSSGYSDAAAKTRADKQET